LHISGADTGYVKVVISQGQIRSCTTSEVLVLMNIQPSQAYYYLLLLTTLAFSYA